MNAMVMVDLPAQRAIYACPCATCRDDPQSDVASDHAAINRVMALLDERQRRLFAGLLAMRRGHGGIIAVATITGLSRTTVRRGIDELRRVSPAAGDRIRQLGGGRRSIEKKTRPW
jgi:hypothetical protein